MTDDFVTTLIAEARQITGWTDAETRAFIRCIRADTPDGLADAIPSALAWARQIETANSMIELMKTLPDKVLHAEWNGTALAVRINPDANVYHDNNDVLNIDPPADA